MEQNFRKVKNPEAIMRREKETERNLLGQLVEGLARQLSGPELAEDLRKQQEQYNQNPELFLEKLEEQALDFLAQKVGGTELADRLRQDREEFARREK